MSANPAISDFELVGSSAAQAAESLGLKREQFANSIGVSVPTVARLKKGAPIPNHKPYELALQLIRLYRGLYAIVGGDAHSMTHWMQSENKHFDDQKPCELIQSAEGLTRVLWYLDAMRGRL